MADRMNYIDTISAHFEPFFPNPTAQEGFVSDIAENGELGSIQSLTQNYQ